MSLITKRTECRYDTSHTHVRAIPEHLRGVITTRCYTNPRLPLPLPYSSCRYITRSKCLVSNLSQPYVRKVKESPWQVVSRLTESNAPYLHWDCGSVQSNTEHRNNCMSDLSSGMTAKPGSNFTILRSNKTQTSLFTCTQHASDWHFY